MIDLINLALNALEVIILVAVLRKYTPLLSTVRELIDSVTDRVDNLD